MFLDKAGIVILLLLCTMLSYGQHTVAGRVIDLKSMEPVNAAKIIFNDNDELATTSGVDGYFEYTSTIPLTILDCTAHGYAPFTMTLKRRKVAILIELLPIDSRKKADSPSRQNEFPHKSD